MIDIQVEFLDWLVSTWDYQIYWPSNGNAEMINIK